MPTEDSRAASPSLLLSTAGRESLLTIYRDGLLHDTLPFWLPRCVDEEYGGFLLARGRDGGLLDTDKGVWQHGRFVREKDPNHPADSRQFSYFAIWRGSEGTAPFAATNPDNLMVDSESGLWFITDGNRRVNGTDYGLYYLDLNPESFCIQTNKYGQIDHELFQQFQI